MRPRKKDRHLPACVYHRHGAYWLVKKGKWTRLGTEPPKVVRGNGPRTAMAQLIDDSLDTIRPTVAANTIKNYITAGERLKYAFADFTPQQITAADVWEFRDNWARTPNMTNRCLSLLKQIMDYAVRRRLIDQNPVVGVDKHPEHKRDRLLTIAEYQAIYAAAGPRLQCIMDMLYLTGQRVADVLKIRRADLTDDGIYFQQQKTGKKILVAWTPQLRAVVERIKGLNAIPVMTLFQSRYRKPPDYKSINLQWRVACAAANVPDAQMRDLRAMSLTELEAQGGDATALAAHSSPAMTNRYLRGKKIAKVSGPVQYLSKTKT